MSDDRTTTFIKAERVTFEVTIVRGCGVDGKQDMDAEWSGVKAALYHFFGVERVRQMARTESNFHERYVEINGVRYKVLPPLGGDLDAPSVGSALAGGSDD